MGCCCTVDISNKYEKKNVEIEPFDLIFLRGNGPISAGISYLQCKLLGNGDWSHVGIAITKKWIPSIRVSSENELLMFESGLSKDNAGTGSESVKDVETKKGQLGVQLKSLDELLQFTAPGREIGVAKLINNPIKKRDNESEGEYEERMKNLREKMIALHKRFQGRIYQVNCCHLLNAFCPYACCGCMKNCCAVAAGGVFCSELVAIILQEIGVMPKNFSADEILPMDIADSKISNEYKRDKTFLQLIHKIVIAERPPPKEEFNTVSLS